MVTVPATNKTLTPATTAVFILVHAMIFNVPFTRVRVEAPTVAPFAITTADTAPANPVGAADTECAAIVPVIDAAVESMPRFRKYFAISRPRDAPGFGRRLQLTCCGTNAAKASSEWLQA